MCVTFKFETRGLACGCRGGLGTLVVFSPVKGKGEHEQDRVGQNQEGHSLHPKGRGGSWS